MFRNGFLGFGYLKYVLRFRATIIKNLEEGTLKACYELESQTKSIIIRDVLRL